MNNETFASSEATFASSDEQYRNVPLKKVVRMFATFCWLHELKIGLNVEIMGVPQVIERVESWNKTSIQRRWKTYQSGEHKPVTWVLDLAELHVSGTKKIFLSPLWAAMRLDKSAMKVARELLGRTTKEGDELLEWLLDRRQTSKVDRWLRKRCKAMVFHASLESLAVLTLCMRLATSKEMPHWTLPFYHFATDSLMILGGWFYQHGIAQANAEYYEKVLLPACYDKDASWLFRSSNYLYIASAIAKAALATQEAAGCELPRTEVISAMLKQLKLYSL